MSDNIRHNRQNEDRLDKRCRDNIPTGIWTRTLKKISGCSVVSRLGVDGDMGVGDYNMRFRFSTMYDAKNRGHSEKVASIF